MKSQIVQDEPDVNTRELHAATEEPNKKQMKVEKEIEAGRKEAEINSTCSENKEKVKDYTKPVKAFAKKSTGQNADTNLMFLSKHRKTSGGKNFTSRLPKGKSLLFLIAPAGSFTFSYLKSFSNCCQRTQYFSQNSSKLKYKVIASGKNKEGQTQDVHKNNTQE